MNTFICKNITYTHKVTVAIFLRDETYGFSCVVVCRRDSDHFSRGHSRGRGCGSCGCDSAICAGSGGP